MLSLMRFSSYCKTFIDIGEQEAERSHHYLEPRPYAPPVEVT